MRTFPFSQDSAIGLPTVITITRATETIRFTTYHTAVTIDGNTYQPGPGATVTNITYPSDGSASTADISVATDGTIITAGDGARGIFDGWPISIGIFDPNDLASGAFEMMPNATIGNVTEDSTGIAVIAVNGALRRTLHQVTEHYALTCRADLYDARCKVDKPSFTGSTTGQATGDFTIVLDSLPDARASDATWYVLGSITVTSGPLVGFPVIAIRAWNPGTLTVTTFLPIALADIPAGTGMDLSAGCDLTRETCFAKFNNIINMRAETFIPPTDPRLI